MMIVLELLLSFSHRIEQRQCEDKPLLVAILARGEDKGRNLPRNLPDVYFFSKTPKHLQINMYIHYMAALHHTTTHLTTSDYIMYAHA